MNKEEEKRLKEERKQFVKEQRAKFKESPENFLRNEILKPWIQAWKDNPWKQLGVFFMWVAIYYLAFGIIQAVNNDMIYCDATINEYDGKVMYVYNDFVAEYNRRVEEMALNPVASVWEQQQVLDNFNEQYAMYCNYDVKRWNNESIPYRLETIGYGLSKILLKRS